MDIVQLLTIQYILYYHCTVFQDILSTWIQVYYTWEAGNSGHTAVWTPRSERLESSDLYYLALLEKCVNYFSSYKSVINTVTVIEKLT